MVESVSPQPSVRFRRFGALIGGFGALFVVLSQFFLPLYVTTFLGSRPYSETSWHLLQIAFDTINRFGIHSFDTFSWFTLSVVIFPPLLACVIFVISSRALFNPLPRPLLRLYLVTSIVGGLVLLLPLQAAFYVTLSWEYWAWIVGYLCMYVGYWDLRRHSINAPTN